MARTNTVENSSGAELEELIDRYFGKDIAGILENPAPEPTPILDKGILVKESKGCIYAKEKVGKSVFALQLGLSCASGQPFLDIPVKQAINVLYLNFEVNESNLEQRILQIKEKLRLDNVPKFRTKTLLGNDIPLLDTSEGFHQVYNILLVHDQQGFHVDLVVWDCRYKTFYRSENEDDVMKEWCRNMDELMKVWDFVPLIVHHEGKRTKGVGAGSSVFDRWINTGIRIKPHGWIAPLRPSKERKMLVGGNYTAGYDQSLVLDYPIHRIGGHEVWQKPLTKQQEAESFILEQLQEGSRAQKDLEKEAQAADITRSTFLNAKKSLESLGMITSNQDPNKAGRYNILELVPLPEEQ